MAKIEEKTKVGRPKLADEELVKDSWCKIISCLTIALVMTVCGIGVLTTRTPLQVLTFQNADNLSGSVVKIKDPNTRTIDVESLENKRTIPAKKATKRIINVDGTVTRIIPANPAGE